MKAKTLPANYFMVTFTVPSELHELIHSNQKIAYATLFKADADTMKKLAKDKRFVGCEFVPCPAWHRIDRTDPGASA